MGNQPLEPTRLAVIAPLDWGLGHLTRMIGLAKMLRDIGYEVRFAIPKNLKPYLQEYGFETVPLAGYKVKYSRRLHPVVSLLFQWPRFAFVMTAEYFWAKKIVRELRPAMLISDNRPFFRNRQTVNIYVTHQLQLPLPPIMSRWLRPLYRKVVEKFDFCLVPDTPENTFAGTISKNIGLKIPTIYSGILSRFTSIESHNNQQQNHDYTLLYIASGPQPQRDQTSENLFRILCHLPGRHAMVGYHKKSTSPKVDIFGHLPSAEFYSLTQRSRFLFSKSGYTTIMDAVAIGKPLIMWPTPGQWEQEYLARHLKDTTGFVVLNRPEEISTLDLNATIEPPTEPSKNKVEQLTQLFRQYAKT